ncbi:hypothetical protein D3C72_2221160 [compost metagenome]
MLTLGVAEPECVAKAVFAVMCTATGMIKTIEVGMVEDGDAHFARCRVERADFGVGLIGNTHHARDDVRHLDLGRS